MSKVVRLSGIVHRYGRQPPVLDGVDLALPLGSSTAIVGPSGSGKTTLLSIVGGTLTPTSGEVHIDGADGSAPDVSWVFQRTNALGHRTVLDNVVLGLISQGIRREDGERLARRALSQVGLEGLETRRAMSLSGGELQRVCIARAVVGTPKLIIADEPTGQLDASTSHAVGVVLIHARPADSALLVATHDSRLAALCDRVLTLRDGRLIDIA